MRSPCIAGRKKHSFKKEGKWYPYCVHCGKDYETIMAEKMLAGYGYV